MIKHRAIIFSLTLTSLPLAIAAAQDEQIPVEYFPSRDNQFTVGLRLGGQARATFRNLGNIPTVQAETDTTSLLSRTYDDGSVFLDTRTDAEGRPLLPDGRTNSWNFGYASQITPDQDGIAFHTYSSTTEGAEISANNGAKLGADLEYSHRIGEFGPVTSDRTRAYSWGGSLGFNFSDVNAKARETIRGTLHTLRDVYSLLGAAPPEPGYSAPSTETGSYVDEDGTVTEYIIDTTTYLASRPDSRAEASQAGAAEIEGFWQVRGAYFTVRLGPWFRWQPNARFSFRAGAGATVSWLGLRLRYEERLLAPDVNREIAAREETQNTSYGIPGVYGNVDFEWWLTDRTGFVGTVFYDYFNRKAELKGLGDRIAEIDVSSGVGFRIGITTRF